MRPIFISDRLLISAKTTALKLSVSANKNSRMRSHFWPSTDYNSTLPVGVLSPRPQIVEQQSTYYRLPVNCFPNRRVTFPFRISYSLFSESHYRTLIRYSSMRRKCPLVHLGRIKKFVLIVWSKYLGQPVKPVRILMCTVYVT